MVARKQANQSQVMVTMEVRNEDGRELGRFDFVLAELKLRAFPTVYQHKFLPKSKDLGSVVPTMHGDGGGVT